MGKYALILFLFCLNFVLAQDNIYKKDNSKIFAKVLEISSEQITYKLPPPADTVILSIPKSEVAIIVFKNGSSEVIKPKSKKALSIIDPIVLENEANRIWSQYSDSLEEAIKLKSKKITLSRKNYIYYNPVELTDQAFGLSYVRNILNNSLCLYIPASIGFGEPYFTNGLLTEHKREYKMDTKNFDAAIGVNFYPYHFNYNSPYIGIMYRYSNLTGQFNWFARNNSFTLNKNYYYLTLGFRSRHTNHFSFMINMHFGVYDNDYPNKNSIVHYDVLSKYNRGSSVNFSIQFGYNL